MAANLGDPAHPSGVSVITCTNRYSFLRNLFRNFNRQRHPRKELIVIVNGDKIPLAPYLQAAGTRRNIRIYRMPEHYTLGACLNDAVRRTKYRYIAKFDDDDYYAPYYLTECLQTFRRTKADIIGKRSHYMYLQGSKTLILRFAGDEYRPVSKLPGATLVFKRDVFKDIRFPDRNVGEDDLFCIRGRRNGYRVYSGGRYNFAAVRRKNSQGHTWIIPDGELIARHRKIPHVRQYRSFVQRAPGVIRR